MHKTSQGKLEKQLAMTPMGAQNLILFQHLKEVSREKQASFAIGRNISGFLTVIGPCGYSWTRLKRCVVRTYNGS